MSPEAGSSWNSGSSWDAAADQTITMANGNHSANHQGRGPFDAAVVEMPDSAERTKQNDQFRWLPDGTPASWAADDEFTWSGQPGTGQVGPDQADMGSAGTGQAAAPPDVDALSAGPAIGEWAPPPQDDVPQPPERTDFWATSVTAASADLKSPAAPLDWIEKPRARAHRDRSNLSRARHLRTHPAARECRRTKRRLRHGTAAGLRRAS